MAMQHKADVDSRLVKGLVMDHGGRHPDMPKDLRKCFIMTLNVSLEYDKSEVASGFFYSSADQREKMVHAERRIVDERVEKILALKREVCTDGQTLVIVNQKGIDPLALDLLAKEGVLGLRRAKRRNMERLTLACGGTALNTLDDLSKDCLGYADHCYEQTLGDDCYTFVEGVANPAACTIMVKGSHSHVIAQIKDSLRDGLRCVVNAIEYPEMLPGAGAFEVGAWQHLMEYQKEVKGRAKLGVQAYAEALLVIPKTLSENAGYDAPDTLIKLQEATKAAGKPMGVDINTGEAFDPTANGIWDQVKVKHQMLEASAVIASQLLLVDECIKAGRQMKKDPMQQQ